MPLGSVALEGRVLLNVRNTILSTLDDNCLFGGNIK
jgi:hypothetical protein